MQPTPEQDRALVEISRWLRGPSQVFYLGGFAGTGKSTIAIHAAEHVDGPVLFGAPTGKSADVMRRKGCAGARTIHSQIYDCQDRSRTHLKQLLEVLGNLRDQEADHTLVEEVEEKVREERERVSSPSFTLREETALRQADLFVVDECPMVNEEMGEDLLKECRKLLVIGDPAQLPPPRGAGFFTKRDPDFTLTEPHRFALDNPIIKLATTVREGGCPPLGQYGESRVMPRSALTAERALEADQILVGRNSTRRATNRRVRSLQGRQGPFPEAGDRLVCLRNNHEEGVLNGTLWDALSIHEDSDFFTGDLRSEDGDRFVCCSMWKDHFLAEPLDLSWWERREAEEFDYGNALTVHKAQGSEFGRVMLLDEWNGSHRRNWVYTGLTRACDMVDWVRMVE